MIRAALFVFFLFCGTASAQETSSFIKNDMAGVWRIYFMESQGSTQQVMFCNVRITAAGEIAQSVTCFETSGEVGGGTSKRTLDSGTLNLARSGRILGSIFFGAGGIVEVKIMDAWMTKGKDAFSGVGKLLGTNFIEVYFISAVKR